jgi:hypothetical protein
VRVALNVLGIYALALAYWLLMLWLWSISTVLVTVGILVTVAGTIVFCLYVTHHTEG